MNSVSLEEFRKNPDKYLAETKTGDVTLTHDGQPWIVLRSVADDQNRWSEAFAASPEFWKIIQERRQERGIPWADAKALLERD